MNDQPDLPTLLREYCWYFVMEMEAKLTLYNKILEQKQPSAIEYLSPLAKAKTPMGALGSAGAQGHQFLKDAKIRDIAGSLARLVHEFRNRETRIARREVMVRACCELFYSFEMQFMSSGDKMGGHLRAMQKLAKDAVVRVLNYYVQPNDTMDDQLYLLTHLRVYCWYFVMEMESKLTLYNKILEQKPPSAFEYLSTLAQAKALIGALVSAGAQGLQFLKDDKNRDNAGSLERLASEFRKRETWIARRKVMVRACCELFYSFEMQFMSSGDKMGGPLRAMQKLAKDAVVGVLNYYVQENVTEPFSVAVITRALTHDLKQGPKNILKQFYSVSNFGGLTFSSSDMYLQVGIITWTDRKPMYYKTKTSKTNQYGYRRLFGWEMEDVDGVLQRLKRDIDREMDYEYTIRYDELEGFSAEVYKYLYDRGDADKHKQAVLSEAKAVILKELDEVKSIWSDGVSNVLREIENMRLDMKMWVDQMEENIKEVQDLLVGGTTNCKALALKNPVMPFTGREFEIQDIHGTSNGRMVVICGVAGMGKTELAREYAIRYKDYFHENILWINAETNNSLTVCFITLARQLRIAENVDGKPKHPSIIVNEVYRKFSDVEALFIFDNVNSQSVIRQFLPKSLDGCKFKVLLTSQLQEWHQMKVILLGVLSKAEAVKLVNDIIGKIDPDREEDVVPLVKAVQYFPLALKHAIAYIIDQSYSCGLYLISDYVAKLQSKANLFISDEFDRCVFPEYFNNTYTKTTFATISLALGRLEAMKRKPKLAISLLNAIAYMEPTDIPKDLFVDWMNWESLNDAVRMLRKFSLITDDEDYIYVHRLVQEILRFIAKRNRTDRTYISEVLILVLTSDSFDNAHFASVLKHATAYADIILDTFKTQARPVKIKLFLLLCENGYYDLYKTILDDNPDLIDCCEDYTKQTSMHLAAVNNRIDFLALLIDKGANLNLQDHYQKTPLYITVERGHLELTKLLVQRGADPKINSKPTLLRVSVLANDFDVFKYIFQVCKGAECEEPDILLKAVHKCNVQIIDYLVQHGYDINKRDYNGCTTLHKACENADAIRCVVAHGVDINSKCNYWGNTPLHDASSSNHPDSVTTLLTLGADPTITNRDGLTALQVALQHRSTEAARRLIDAGANINQANPGGWYALHYAASHRYLHFMKYLLHKGANVYCRDEDERTPLHIITMHNNREGIKFLLDNGADVNVKCDNGRTPLHEAAVRGNISVCKLLHSYKADVNSKDIVLRTPLHYAATFRYVDWRSVRPRYDKDSGEHLNLIRTLLQLGADLEARSAGGYTPLHEAIISGQVNVPFLLISRGASVNCKCEKSFTLQHEVALRDFKEMEKTLMENGATCDDNDYNYDVYADHSGHFYYDELYLEKLKHHIS